MGFFHATSHFLCLFPLMVHGGHSSIAKLSGNHRPIRSWTVHNDVATAALVEAFTAHLASLANIIIPINTIVEGCCCCNHCRIYLKVVVLFHHFFSRLDE